MLSPTLRQIEYAVAVGQHGGMNAAAQALHVSQPALSVALGQLEAGLGAALFLRRPGGRLSPSPFGHRWLAAAALALEATARLADPRKLDAGPLRLAIFEDLAASCLAPLLAHAECRAGRIVIDASLMGFEALGAALREGRCDMALSWDLGLEADIARDVLLRVPPHAVLAPDHPLTRQSRLRLADLAGEPLVLADQGLSISHMRALFARAGVSPRIAHRTATLELMRSFAANGLGVGLSYSLPAHDLSQDGRALVTRPIADAGSEALVLARLAAGPVLPRAEALIRVLPDLLAPPAFRYRAPSDAAVI